jgi:hypothetical protein
LPSASLIQLSRKDTLFLQSERSLSSRKASLVPKDRHVIEFLTSQGIAMGARLFDGFLCVWLLPVAEYAKFAVVYGFMCTLWKVAGALVTFDRGDVHE